MTRYQRIARRAIAARLADLREPVLFFTLSTWADEAARQAGKRRDLWPSLYDYERILPQGWRTAWLRCRGGTDSLLFAVPRDWAPGVTQSNSLLLGAGTLVYDNR